MWIKEADHEYPLLRLSPTRMSLASRCPRCYWLVGKGIRQPRGIFPSIPGGIDRCMKSLAQSGRSRRNMPRLLNELLPGRKLYTEQARRLKWYCEWLHAELVGEPDEWCIEPTGELSLIDYKTKGSSPSGVYHPSYRTQLDLYALLVQKQAGFPPISGKAYLVYLYPTTAGDDLSMGSEVVEVPVDARAALSKFQMAVSMIRGGALPPSLDCEHCLREARIMELARDASDVGLTEDFVRQAAARAAAETIVESDK